MQMVYNSDNFAVVRFDLPAEDGAPTAASPAAARGGYEIVDKFARKEIYLDGALAASFKEGVAALIDKASSEEEFDAWLGRYAALMQQPLTAH
jgi:hypothetical protein